MADCRLVNPSPVGSPSFDNRHSAIRESSICSLQSPMVDPAEYCRQVEAYLCRKNEGHLVRIAGPVFEQVSGWASQGVPLAVVFRGIDRYCERYYAKGPRRRPVRVEFCEADILELFDDWRRWIASSSTPRAAKPAKHAVPLSSPKPRPRSPRSPRA